MDTIEALRSRRSVRRYEDRPVDKTLLETVVDCGRLAATARNEQPWEFIVVTDPATRQTIAETTNYGKFIAQSPVCIAVLCAPADYYLEDGSAATQNMLVAARALGLATCWVAGDRKPYADDLRALLGAPEGFKLISLVALGYSSDTPNPPKRSLQDVLHWERF